jgi:NADP-dependent 3-hydroxy acid dehydrogenase YdfG
MIVNAQAGTKLDYQPQEVDGKAVLISGGTTGIGRATAILLGAHGARLMIFGRHEPELTEALEDIRQAGAEVYGTVADQARLEDVKRVFQEADRELGSLDILINNAALPGGSIETTENWPYILQSNLQGYMACTYEAVNRMKASGSGHIVNIGSLSADVREEGSSVYVATKSAIQGFSEALRKEVNQHGIKVSLIEPGSVGTDMVEASPEQQDKKQAELKMLKAEDIAASVYYCLTQPQRTDVIVVQIRPHLQSI